MGKKGFAPAYYAHVDGYCNNKPFVILHTGDLELENTTESLYTFNTKAYAILHRDAETFNNTVNPVNDFLQKLSPEHQKLYVMFMAEVKYMIMTHTEQDDHEAYTELIVRIDQFLNALDEEMGLCELVEDYIAKYVPIEQQEDAGKKPQHSAATTFLADELAILSGFMLISKLFMPILSELQLKAREATFKEFREQDPARIFNTLYNKHYPEMMEKFNFYINNSVSRAIKKDQIAAYCGLVIDRMTPEVRAKTLIKKFVTEDIMNGNPARYMTSSVRNETQSVYNNSRNRKRVYAREDPISNAQDGNTSRLEAESKPSRSPLDTPILLARQTKDIWKEFVADSNLDMEVIEEAYNYYMMNPIDKTPVSSFIVTNYFGVKFGGGQGLAYTDMMMYTKLCCTLQYIMAVMGDKYLIHLLTMSKSDKIKKGKTDADNRLIYTWTSTGEYKRCNDAFPEGFGDKAWRDKPKDLVDLMTDHEFLYNTAPVFWEMLEERATNGKVIEDFTDAVRGLCNLLYNVYIEEEE